MIKQINRLRLFAPNKNTEKFQVKTPTNVVLEEFTTQPAAEQFMRETKDYVTPRRR